MTILKDGNMPSVVAGALTFTPVASHLVEILAREEAIVEQVGALLGVAPEFVSGVLRLPGASGFGPARHVRSLAKAAVLLGPSRLRALIAMMVLRRSGGCFRAVSAHWLHDVGAAFSAANRASPPAFGPESAAAREPDTHQGLPVAQRNGACEGADGQGASEGLASEYPDLSSLQIPLSAPVLEGVLDALTPRARMAITAEVAGAVRMLEGNTINN